MIQELKDLMEKLNKKLIASARRERPLINSAIYLKRIVKKLGLEEGELKNIIGAIEAIFFRLQEYHDFIPNEIQKLQDTYKKIQVVANSSEKILKKLDAQQMWLFENIDNYVDKALEHRLRLLLEEKERNNVL